MIIENSKIRVLLFFVLIATMTACSGTNFTGSNGKKNSSKVNGPGEDDQAIVSDDDDDSDDRNDLEANGVKTETFKGQRDVTREPVDIFFAMDTSSSMNKEKGMLESKMAVFIGQFLAQNDKVDFHIYMVGEDFSFPNTDDSRITLIDTEVDSHNSLVVLMNFFGGGYANPVPIREETKKEIVVVTDDEAKRNSDTAFRQFVSQTPSLTGKVSLNGFVGLPTSAENDWCKIDGEGDRYVALAADPAMKGLIQDLCVEDWGQLMTNLADKILSEKVTVSFKLSKKADPDESIKVSIDGKKVASTSYTYNEDENSIVFSSDEAPDDDAEVVVEYSIAAD